MKRAFRATPATTDRNGVVSAFLPDGDFTIYLMPDDSFRVERASEKHTWRAGDVPDGWRNKFDFLKRNRG